MKFISAVFVTFLACSPLSYAADEISPEKLALAGDLMEASGAKQMVASSDAMMNAMFGQMRKTIPNLDDETFQALQKIAREEFEASKPQLLSDSQKIYARHFSEGEMRDMITFYKSPTGRRVVSEMPAIMQETGPLTAELMQRVVKRVMAYMQERAKQKDKPAQ